MNPERRLELEGIELFTGKPTRVETAGESIVSVQEIDFRPTLPFLAPGFIDLQVNGYRGVDYSSESLDENEIETLICSIAASGTTVHLPTIITRPRETILRNLSLLERVRAGSPAAARAIPGYHIEGPFISPEVGPRGAHSLANVRDADYDEFQLWQQAAGGRIKMLTIAPEVPGAISLIERVSREGILVAIGHTAASPATVRDAIMAGARLSTHLGNGSHAMLPRLANYVWEQLAADELSAGIISDGYHLPPAVVKTMARAKSLARLFLVSDVAVHGGASPGIYQWSDTTVEVFADGHLGVHGTDFLAGAGHLLDRDVALFARFVGCPLADAVRLCTLNPARLLGLPDSEKFCVEGARADLVLFDYATGADRLSIRKTVQAGRLLFG